jgi:hypothetical protein
MHVFGLQRGIDAGFCVTIAKHRTVGSQFVDRDRARFLANDVKRFLAVRSAAASC